MNQKMIESVGLGLRFQHFDEILKNNHNVPWFEILVDNFFSDGPHHQKLEKVIESTPIVFHGVGLNLGSVDPLDKSYLKKLKELKCRYNPQWISDHICWSALAGRHHHDLLPLPYTEEAIELLVSKIIQVQDFLGERVLIENLSDYIEFKQSEMNEWEFVEEILKRADCYMLLDLNNLLVNVEHHDFDPLVYLNALSKERVKQIHLAGPDREGEYVVDTHGSDVSEKTIELLKSALEIFGPVPSMIERDNNIPPFEELLLERQKILNCYET